MAATNQEPGLFRIPLTTEILRSYPANGGYACSVHELFDLGLYRYHTLISVTNETPPCIEKTLLTAINLETPQEERERAWRDMEELWYPFLKADYISRGGNMPPQSHPGEPLLVKLQILTVDGKLTTSDHTEHIKWPRHDPVPNEWPNLEVFPSQCIAMGPEAHSRLGHTIQINGSNYHLKSVQGFLDVEFFILFIRNLLKLHGHQGFPVLVGLVESAAGDGSIEGIVKEHMDGAFLDEIDPTTYPTLTRKRWKTQICNAVAIMDGVQVTWDACPAAVFIKKNDDGQEEAIICGVGGGKLIGGEVVGPRAGEAKGLSELLDYIDGVGHFVK